MKTVTLYNTPTFVVVSLGNGLMYEFVNKAADRTVFVQGDDALAFNVELDYVAAQHESFETALAGLWSDYEPVAR